MVCKINITQCRCSMNITRRARGPHHNHGEAASYKRVPAQPHTCTLCFVWRPAALMLPKIFGLGSPPIPTINSKTSKKWEIDCTSPHWAAAAPNFKYCSKAPFHTQSMKASPVTIACKTAKLLVFFFYRSTQRGRTIVYSIALQRFLLCVWLLMYGVQDTSITQCRYSMNIIRRTWGPHHCHRKQLALKGYQSKPNLIISVFDLPY